MNDGMMENVYQLALLDLLFQAVGVFLNVILQLFQSGLTSLLQGIFGAIAGGSA